MLALAIEDPDATGGGDPDIARFIRLQAVGDSRLIRLQIGEDASVPEGAAAGDVEDAHVSRSAVGYVELLLVGRQRYAIGAITLVVGNAQIARARDLIHQ